MSARFVKAKIASEELGVSPAVLRDWDKKKWIHTIRSPGNIRLYDVNSLVKDRVAAKQKTVQETLIVAKDVALANDTEAPKDTSAQVVDATDDAWQKEIESVFKAVHESANKKNSSEFCIDFEKAATWIGFTRKDHAKNLLEKTCEENLDFSILPFQRGNSSSNDVVGHIKAGRPAEIIRITTDCFKTLCMTARTEQGRRVRKFYLELEKRLRNGDLTLAGEIVQNYDAVNGTKTNVLLQTHAAGLPRWVPEWRDARSEQMDRGKTLHDALKEMDLKDGSIYAIVENMHNQGVLGFNTTTTQFRKDNQLAKNKPLAEIMDKTQLDLRRMMSIKLIQLYSEVQNPTVAQIKHVTLGVKNKIADMSAYMDCNRYKPEIDDRGNEVHIGKRVRELEAKHRRTLKRLKAIEEKQSNEGAQVFPASVDKGQKTLNSFFTAKV